MIRFLEFSDEDVLRICREHISGEVNILISQMEKKSVEEDNRLSYECDKLWAMDYRDDPDVKERIFAEALRKRLFDDSVFIEYC